jgi:large subunit ribosomal protein L18
MTTKTNELRSRRQERLRHKLSQARSSRVRLSVFRSSKQIYAQVIDDQAGKTLAAASSIEKDLRGSLKTGATIEAAAAVGKLLAERAKAAGVGKVVFDRGHYLYHGRVKALADAAREGGLDF